MDVLPLASHVSICDKSIIKPSSLIPCTLNTTSCLLLINPLVICIFLLLFFYPTKQRETYDTIISKSTKDSELSHIAHLLKKSLSQILTSYYPYARRLRDNATVDCNDKGAEFLTVQIKCPMSEIINHPNPDVETLVFPKRLPWKDNIFYEDGNLLVAQTSQFDCGGIAVSACLSHMIGDGYSVLNFLTDWARATRDHVTNTTTATTNQYSAPRFVGDSIFVSPQIITNNNNNIGDPLVIAPQIESNIINDHECITRRFIFPSNKLEALRAKVIAESGLQNPTRAEIVSALLFKCAVKAASKLSSCSNINMRPSKLVHYLNVRTMIKPRLPRNAIGNLLSVFSIEATNKKEIELPRLVRNLRKGVEEAYKKDQVNENELIIELVESMKKGKLLFETSDGCDVYICSNAIKFPIYNINFGWGKPERAGYLPNGPFNNMFFLSDYQSGRGMDVRVTLQKQQMAAFECDEELLQFVL